MGSLVRIGTEHLLRQVFLVARLAFLAQALAIGATVASSPLRAMFPEYAPWLAEVGRTMLFIGGTFTAGGLLLFAVPWFVPPRGNDRPGEVGDGEPARRDIAPDALGAGGPDRRGPDGRARGGLAPGAMALLGWSLVALPVVAALSSAELFALWRDVVELLRRADFDQVLRSSYGMGGLVFAPVMAALYVPFVQLVLAVFLVAVPAGVLVLFHARSHRFTRMFVMMVVCQVVLVVASMIGTDLFTRVALVIERVPEIGADPVALPWLERLRHAVAVLRSTSLHHLGLALVYAAWSPALLQVTTPFVVGADVAEAEAGAPARNAEPLDGADPATVAAVLDPRAGDAYAAADPATAVVETVDAPAAARASEPPADPQADFDRVLRRLRARTAASRGPAALGTGAPGGGWQDLAPVAALSLGASLLFVGACDSVLPRARFADSTPAPSATLDAAPAAVVVRFTQPLGPGSRLSVFRTWSATDPAVRAEESPGEVAASAGETGSRQRRTLSTPLPPGVGRGLYRVDWRAAPSGTGVARSGHFYFGVGLPVPEAVDGFATSLDDRDVGGRQRRATMLGGVLLLGLGALIPSMRGLGARTRRPAGGASVAGPRIG